jgi:hypothetical protein
MAADEKVLGELHTAVAKVLTEALKGQELPGYFDPETSQEVPGQTLPPSAAIIAAATKFLKDNNITCAPSKDNALGELEEAMKARRAKRIASKTDMRVATEDMAFMNGLPN